MPVRALAVLSALLACASPAAALTGRLLDQKTGKPIAGAEISITGLSGSVRTDADGRFVWTPDPRPPFVVIVLLPDGRLARPITVDKVDAAAGLTLTVQPISEEITVAIGAAPSVETTPGAAMTMVTARDVAMRMPANLMQAIETVPGVNQVSEGQAAVPAVRGLARGRTLLLIDGSRVSSERRVGPSATFIDPSVIDTVDVARGAGSVAYGSDAFGGVISIRTRRPGFTGTTVDGSVTLGAGIPDRRADVTFTRGFGTSGILISAHGRSVDDYDGPDAAVLNSGYGDSGFLVRADRTTAGGLMSVSWQSDFGRDIERPRNNSNAVRFYYPFENSHRLNVLFERPALAGLGAFKASGFFGTIAQRTDQDRLPTSSRARDIVRADISARDFQARASIETRRAGTRLEFGTDINGRLGLEAHDVVIQYDLAGAVVSNSDTLSVESASRVDTGVFLQADRALASRLSAAGGVRLDYVRNVNNGGFFGDRTVSNAAAAGFGALTAGPFEHVTLTAQLSRGFRDPTLSDRFFRGPSGRGFITGNPDLEPETSLQVDLGARYATDRLQVAAYYYGYRITNLVERFQTDPDFFFFRNRGRARITGVELEAQAALGRGFSVEVGAQHSRGRAVDDGTALDDISPDSASVVLRKTFGARVSAFARVAWYDADDRPGPSEIPAPGHTNVDAGATWELNRRVEIRGAVRNLLNEQYFASPDPRFVPAPGVNGFVTVRVRF
jgi:outer membrane receptor protein involved in Fe transport